MGYLIDKLRRRKSEKMVLTQDLILENVNDNAEYIERESEGVRSFKTPEPDATPESAYVTIDSNSGSVEKTPFPMYVEENGSRKLDIEKVSYYLKKIFGEGIYRIRFSDGRGFKIVVNNLCVVGEEKWQRLQ